jgi:RNA polymerase sigma-70 factor, ECF subfamily
MQLRGCIFASLGNHADAEDVLQRTNLALLRKAANFPEGGRFLPWALGVAKYEILSFVRDARRERLVFNADLVELMCDASDQEAHSISDRHDALRGCLEKLPERSRQILAMRYINNRNLEQIAHSTNRSIDGAKSILFRLRRKLERCIERNMARSR